MPTDQAQTPDLSLLQPLHVVLVSRTSDSLRHKLVRNRMFGSQIVVDAYPDLAAFFAAPTGQLDLLMLDLTSAHDFHCEQLQALHLSQPQLPIYGYTLSETSSQPPLPFLTHLRNPSMHSLYQTLQEEVRKLLHPPSAAVELRIVPVQEPQPNQPSSGRPAALDPVLPAENRNRTLLPSKRKVPPMSAMSRSLQAALRGIEGATAVAIVDYHNARMLGSAGGGINLELACAGNTEVVRAKMRVMDRLGIQGSIEDMLITLDTQYHIIYLVPGMSLFLYLVLQKDQANLALARYKLKALGAELRV
ncbi:hypothetical protein [Deinococcus roseus]|uniref:Response regulatory domain-containing protein n=1 Tax=Deinococcus roseus TaxID=392414 RepID=A0ABQ2D117_9DEIO|nr:hypothetical protein [Deinococcus roseus]GGJ35824.1 hypothetical protein GCM10008938_22470 [Deinococcus roseus]